MKKVLIIVALVAVVGTGLYFYYKKQSSLLEEMTYKIVGFNVQTISLNQTIINLKLQITSDSVIQTEISDLNIDIYLDDFKIGTVNNLAKFVLPAKGYTIVDTKVTILPGETSTHALELIFGYLKNKDTKVRIEGYAKASVAGLNIPTPVSYTTTVKQILGGI